MILYHIEANHPTEKIIEPTRNARSARLESISLDVHAVDSKLALGHIENQ